MDNHTGGTVYSSANYSKKKKKKETQKKKEHRQAWSLRMAA
jgi:hypothetical protein